VAPLAEPVLEAAQQHDPDALRGGLSNRAHHELLVARDAREM
jgi:hypothetical protein